MVFRGKLAGIAGSTMMVGDYVLLDEQGKVLCFIRETHVPLESLAGQDCVIEGVPAWPKETGEPLVIDVISAHLIGEGES